MMQVSLTTEMLSLPQHQFDNIEEISEHSVATTLDPQFKDNCFLKAETKQSARKYLTDNSVDCAELPTPW